MSLIITLILLAFLLFFFEIFVPGGILAVIGALLLLVAAGLAYDAYGLLAAAAIFFGGCTVGVIAFFAEVRWIARSPLGAQFALKSTSPNPPAEHPLKKLEGKAGATLTTFSPSGKVLLDGVDYTASTRGEYLPKGASVRVVRADTFHLIIEKS